MENDLYVATHEVISSYQQSSSSQKGLLNNFLPANVPYRSNNLPAVTEVNLDDIN